MIVYVLGCLWRRCNSIPNWRNHWNSVKRLSLCDTTLCPGTFSTKLGSEQGSLDISLLSSLCNQLPCSYLPLLSPENQSFPWHMSNSSHCFDSLDVCSGTQGKGCLQSWSFDICIIYATWLVSASLVTSHVWYLKQWLMVVKHNSFLQGWEA